MKTSFPLSKRETASFCSHFNTSPPRWDTYDQNQNILEKIILNRCHFGLSYEVINVTFCHSSCQSSALINSIVPSTNQVLPLLEQLTQRTQARVKLLQSPFFPLLHPHAFNPTATTHRHFVLSPVSLASRDQDGSPSNSTIDIYDLTEK